MLLNSETADVGQVIDGKRLVQTPLNGHNYLQLAQLIAGLLLPNNGRTSGGGGFLAFGQHTNHNNVLLDQMADDSGHIVRPSISPAGESNVQAGLGQMLKWNLFVSDIVRKEISYYKTKQNTFGLPLDNRSTDTKLNGFFG